MLVECSRCGVSKGDGGFSLNEISDMTADEFDAAVRASAAERWNRRAPSSVLTPSLRSRMTMTATDNAKAPTTDERVAELKLWLERKWQRYREEEDLEAASVLTEVLATRQALRDALPGLEQYELELSESNDGNYKWLAWRDETLKAVRKLIALAWKHA
jgi:hypothetical protein